MCKGDKILERERERNLIYGGDKERLLIFHKNLFRPKNYLFINFWENEKRGGDYFKKNYLFINFGNGKGEG